MLTLQDYVAQRGWTGADFAEAIGVNVTTAYEILGGRRLPKPRTLAAINALHPELHLRVSHYVERSRVLTTDDSPVCMRLPHKKNGHAF
jgi:transcriptional regulator with XRE-family HTH domain